MLIGLLLTKAKSSHAKYETVGGCWFQSVCITGNFSQFSGTFVCIYSTLVLKKLFFTVLQQQTAFLRRKVPAIDILLSEHKSGQTRQAANSLLLACEHSPDVNNKPISIPYLEQGYRWNITIFNLKVES